MRKYLILLIIYVCGHPVTRGQTMPDIDLSRLPQATQAKSVSYWFDDDVDAIKSTNVLSGRQTLDASALLEGLHTLHMKIVDTRDVIAPVNSTLFFKTYANTAATAKSFRYWFDSKVTTLKTVSAESGVSTIDASALTEGLHTFHCQVIAADDNAYTINSAIFLKVEDHSTAFKTAKLSYWFDSGKTPTSIEIKSGIKTLDVSGLNEGIHTIHCQLIGGDDVAYTLSSAIFMKLDDHSNAITAGKLNYWFDSKKTVKTVDATSGALILDAGELITGLHTLHCQVVDADGNVCPPTSALFLKLSDKAVQEAATISYWFDEDDASAIQSDVSNLVKIVDAERLKEGPHALHYQLKSASGEVFPICSAAFERWLFDIYVKESTEYSAATISSDPLFGRNPWMKLHYSADDTAVRGRLTVDEGVTLSLGKYMQTGNLGANPWYNEGYDFTSTGTDSYHPTTLINQGFMRADSVKVSENVYHDRWHFISLPFNAAVSNIDMPDDTYWALRRYDGEARAAGIAEATWQNLRPGDMMEAGQGYILQLTREGNDQTTQLIFKAENDTRKNDIFKSEDAEVTLSEHQSEFAHNRSWNLTGNPYPSFFDTRFIEPGGIITVWNGNGYSAYSLTDDDYVLMPFEAFFIQKPLNTAGLTFSAEGRQHTNEVRQIAPVRTRQADNQNRRIVNITVMDGRQSDRTRLVINEHASSVYEADKDAPKFFAGNDMSGDGDELPPAVQLYSVEAGVKYAINERPMGNGYATLSLLVPQDGDYSLLVDGHSELTEKLAILDTETGRTWTVADGELTFNAIAGRHDGRFVIAFDGQTTGIGQQTLMADGEMSVMDGQLTFRFARERNLKVFATDGRLLYSLQGNTGAVGLTSGIYLINVDGKTTKVIVK